MTVDKIIKRWEPSLIINKEDLERVSKSIFHSRKLSAATIKRLEDEGMLRDDE